MSEYRITDIHSHILFGVDDGPETIEESLKMLIIAQQQGVKNVFCTPHSGQFDAFVYNKNFTELKKRSEEEGISIKLFEGMEFLSSELYETKNIKPSKSYTIKTLNNTEYVLLEFYWYMSCEEIFSQLDDFINRTEKKAIISHIERYRSFHTDDEAVKKLREKGCLFQINICSIVNENDAQIKKFAQKLLTEKYVDFVGSDSHGINYRPPSLKSGVNYIYSNFNKEYADNICFKNAEDLLLK